MLNVKDQPQLLRARRNLCIEGLDGPAVDGEARRRDLRQGLRLSAADHQHKGRYHGKQRRQGGACFCRNGGAAEK